MATWPAYAEIKLDGFGLEPESALLRTDMESGPPLQTRTKSRVMVPMQMIVRFMSKASLLDFLDWWRDDLGLGAGWFDFTHPVTGLTVQARIAGGKLGRYEPAGSLDRWHMPLTLEYWDV